MNWNSGMSFFSDFHSMRNCNEFSGLRFVLSAVWRGEGRAVAAAVSRPVSAALKMNINVDTRAGTGHQKYVTIN